MNAYLAQQLIATRTTEMRTAAAQRAAGRTAGRATRRATAADPSRGRGPGRRHHRTARAAGNRAVPAQFDLVCDAALAEWTAADRDDSPALRLLGARSGSERVGG